MELEFGPEIINSYKRLAYQTWYAIAEFVDNSTQAYFNNQSQLDKAFKKEGARLTVEITSGKDSKGEFIRVSDNSMGMSEKELERAVHVGKPPLDPTGRSRYGLGLKTGACWFGDYWTIETKKLGDTTWHRLFFDVPEVADGDLDLPHQTKKADPSKHFTIVEIRELHQRLSGRALGKVKNHLRSLYRRDIAKERLVLIVNGDTLSWDSEQDIEKRLLLKKNGERAKQTFKFKVKGKTVSGWAGVWEKGSRRNAGFSLIQCDRVITGWPESYRPTTLFGQEGGSNDLVNQRLFGEIVVDDFEVSHTKDQIIYRDNEQELLEAELGERLAGLRQLALSHRKGADERVRKATEVDRTAALNVLEREMKSEQMQDFLQTFEIPSASLIAKANEAVKQSVVKRFDPDLTATINKIKISIYTVNDMSPNDPYVIIESTKSTTSVIVIINMAHPHWAQISNKESVLNFIRHCTYDGVSECKAYAVTGKLEPDTIKLIKDNLLRIPMTLGVS